VNASQRAFAALAILDMEISNGGLSQFLWNCPGWVDVVPTALQQVSLIELATAFERAVGDLVARIGEYTEYRKRDSLEAYVDAVSEFSFDEFDSMYDELAEEIRKRSVAFVSQDLVKFVG
jgi:hypothetical protein